MVSGTSVQPQTVDFSDAAPVARPPLRARLIAVLPDWLIHALRVHGPIVSLLAVSLGLRLYRLGERAGQLIGDEEWYIQDARVLLGLPVHLHHLPSAPLSGLDPNSEHPPLAKLIIAGSMKLFGVREFAWRLPSVLLGTLSIWLLYRIVLALRGSQGQAFFAAFLLAFDNMSFIHGRIAMLDVYMVTFLLLGTLLYLHDYFELSGVAFAVGALCKLTGLLGLFAMLLYDALLARKQWREPSWPSLRRRAAAVVFCGGFLILGLGALDCYFTEFHSPFAHFYSMFHYHSGLKHTGPSSGNESTPFQWWLNSGTMDYSSWNITSNGVTQRALFRSEMNHYLIFVAPFALFYAAQQTWKNGSRLGAFALASVAGNFGPMFLVWAIMSRTSYIFYMLPSIPGIASAVTLGVFALPRPIRWAYAGGILYAFFFSFPFKYF